ncbi:SGNH/GDSL hydrolase family protein [Spirosoma panaciterrae]|uniref:SGNH/GDSL hydrolase family protein n=1 Tax=Spirosoma panaciterrae TaxID=496058 RepID=UPI00036B8E34|nr:SGNH/GDSL hydrolase family protein [Spirosoma panaciterrae]
MHAASRFRWALIVTVVVSINACTNNDIDPNGSSTGTPTKGSADFTKYVAVGNSLTSGYADNGLYRDSQLNSYPNILAGQFKTVGGGDFIQPLFSEAQAAGSGYIKLVKVPNPSDPTSLASSLGQVAPAAIRGTSPGGGGPLYTKFTGTNQNLGVPGIRMADLLSPGYGSSLGNPYFERLLPDQSSTTYFQYASDNLNGATFFTCWLGNNDALGYALAGGVSADNLTSTTLFTTNFTAIMNKLTEGGRKGVVIGIPTVTMTPYFTTATDQINALLKVQGLSGLAISSKSAPGGVRLSGAGDYFLLSIASVLNSFIAKGVGLSASNPVPDQYVLDASEVSTLNTRINEFNTIMKTQADAKGLVYVDVNPIFQQLAQTGGYKLNGITYSTVFIQGGVFSLDGIHLTPAGYAMVANEIIKGINTKYGSTIPQVNPANYRRVLLQQ